MQRERIDVGMQDGAAVASVKRNRRKLVFRHVFRPRHELIHAGKQPLPVVEHGFDANLLVVHKRHQIGQRLGVIADLQIADDAPMMPHRLHNAVDRTFLIGRGKTVRVRGEEDEARCIVRVIQPRKRLDVSLEGSAFRVHALVFVDVVREE